MDRDTVLKVALQVIRSRSTGNYSAETSDNLRKALVDLNGGSTKINIKTFHRGNALYDLIEELLPAIIEEGITSDNALISHTDYRNIAEGDEAEFRTEGKADFLVADVAHGIRTPRRQRIEDGDVYTLKTTLKMVRVYEGLGRLLANRVDFNTFIDGVARAFNKQINTDIYTEIAGITASTKGLNATYVRSGTYSEDVLFDIIQHVEAATGSTAIILGTKAALRKVTTAEVSDRAKEDRYNLGYYGKFNGTDMIFMKQVHDPGTDTFTLNDSKLYVIASDDKFIKLVNEGTGLLIERNAAENADLTQEYIYGQAYGVGVAVRDKFGIYTLSSGAST